MRKLALLLYFCCFVQCACLFALGQGGSDGYVPVRTYDPSRNAAQDVLAAQQEAKRTGRNVLIDVGGNWCIWCHIMDRFFQTHTDLAELRDRNYVTVFVNFSPENKNREFLSRFPGIPGYPHLFVLNSDGKLLHSQDTSALEQGNGYNASKVRQFLLKWAPEKGARSPAAASEIVTLRTAAVFRGTSALAAEGKAGWGRSSGRLQ